MEREFILLKVFEKNWEQLKLNDDDLIKLENLIMSDENIGDLIVGTGGLRKMRFPLRNKGKSGGIRILYVDFVSDEKTILMNVYSKNQMDNISDEHKQEYKKLINLIREGLKNE